MKFAWEGTTREGQLRKGVVDAANKAEAEAKLRQSGITATSVKRSLGSIEIRLPRLGGVKTKTLVVFTRQLSTMIDAGLPLVQCLDILASQEPDRDFQEVIYGVKAQVEQGSTLAESVKKYPKVFDTLFVSLVAAGEVGGILDTILNRLAQYVEKSMKTKQKVASALKYPAFVLIAAGGIMVVMLWKVIPSFAGMFQSVGNRELPAMTQFVVNMSNTFIDRLPWITLISIALVVAFIMFKRSKFGGRFLDLMLLKLPVFGTLVRKAAIARFTRTLGTLVSAGVPILDGLEVVANSAGNKIIEEGVMYVRSKVAEGKNIAGPLEETKIFPKMVVQMIGVGEQTGAMDVMLSKIADFYDDEVDASVDAITSLIEPMMMIVIGGMVGFVLIAMYLPIFGMADNLSGS
ncbi:MAG TPA: type II secretion system F family protein [Myxococcota bacterium]|nr:type II secretion system F family protein [Myxococcota bacterium]HON25910.1 type II secretion system F family protein [Myxococcota bacterium]HOS62484.1 type II secretion system F family protein [Myxococcota bacterium]HPC92560.1 type II secretion system F family protein [Myxococcota bacterium]HPL26044.1 type II secretion system F family protein [Myxococcota bacterium]